MSVMNNISIVAAQVRAENAQPKSQGSGSPESSGVTIAMDMKPVLSFGDSCNQVHDQMQQAIQTHAAILQSWVVAPEGTDQSSYLQYYAQQAQSHITAAGSGNVLSR